ncbi:MAG: hypothetical protein OEM60_00335 [Gammaproteobacteria bacterium]|nr:hypothetical protein [Gammaproteobacteria bacterium]MDH3428521.1 hypothetical protein [Gammaproteobacteria bacterium]MDH3432277.1 hypothetical protein [Gammaproteobacteria bacterium]
MSASRSALIGSLLLGCGVVLAADDEVPDVAFLEYLGLWEESDEDWLIFDEPITADAEKRSDPVPEGKESTEKTDES